MFEFEPIDVTVPLADRDDIAGRAKAAGLPLLTVARVLAVAIDTTANVGMDAVRHLTDAITRREQWPQDVSHITDDRRRYEESIRLLIRSGAISDKALAQLIELASVDSRHDCEPLEVDVEIGLAGECRCGGVYWFSDNVCHACGEGQ